MSFFATKTNEKSSFFMNITQSYVNPAKMQTLSKFIYHYLPYNFLANQGILDMVLAF